MRWWDQTGIYWEKEKERGAETESEAESETDMEGEETRDTESRASGSSGAEWSEASADEWEVRQTGSARRITGMQTHRGRDGKWFYPSLVGAMKE